MKIRRICIAFIMVSVMLVSLASGVFAYRVAYESKSFDNPSTNVQSTINGGLYKGPVTYNSVVYQYMADTQCSHAIGENGITMIWARVVGSAATYAGGKQCDAFGNTGMSDHGAKNANRSCIIELYDPTT